MTTTTVKQKTQEGQKVVVVTGASRGIGLHLATQLSQCKRPDSTSLTFKVVATVRNVEAVPSSLSESGCDVQCLDVSDEASLQRVVSYVETTYGRCDILVNNAGYGISGSFETVAVSDAKQVFDVNVWAVMRLCQLIVPLMRKHRNGFIITVSSMSGFIGQPFTDIYTASKHAIEGMMESFRFSVVPDNIKVSLVNPGPTRTDFAARLITETEQGQKQQEAESSSEDKGHRIATYWAKEIQRRNANGHPVEDCAEEIVTVIERDMDRYIADGEDLVPFRNATSDQVRQVLKDVLVYPDGVSGVYAERFKVARDIEQACLGL